MLPGLAFSPPTLSPRFINLAEVTVHAISFFQVSTRFYFSALPDIYHFIQHLPYLERLTLRLHFDISKRFSFHEKDVSLILLMLQQRHPDRPVHIKLHISAAKSQKMAPPSEILSSIERKNPDLLEIADRGSLSIVAEDHFCANLSCCS